MSQELVRKVYTGEVIQKAGDATIEITAEVAAFHDAIEQMKRAIAAAFMGVAVPYVRPIIHAEIIDQEPTD
jgi:2-keto-3-deoxy-6-phosphogluconate aldolase